MRSDRPNITIAGAGIAGLTAALFLEQSGFNVSVIERNPEPATTGTGIQLSPNAFKVLDKLGLSFAVKEAGFAPTAIDIQSGLTGTQLTRVALGDSIGRRHGAPYLVLHRSDLAKIFLAACGQRAGIDLQYGQQVTEVRRHGDRIQMTTEQHGKQIDHTASALIGADGVWSVVRQSVTGAAIPEFTGRIAWRAVLPMSDIPRNLSRDSTELWLGPDAHLVHYPLAGGEQLNVIAVTPWTGNQPPDKGWINQCRPGDRLDAFANWRSELRELLRQDVDWGGWPIFAIEQVQSMVEGPVCLIGDAAHPMVPFGAQGGASAIEDAFVLATCCAAQSDNLPAAFSAFEAQRKPRVQKIMELSNNNRRIYHMGRPLSLARNVAMRLVPEAAVQKRMDWLYGWEG